MIRLLTDLGTDAPYGSSLRISRTVRYHSVGATRQGRPSPGRPGGSFHRVRRRKIRSDCPDRFLLGKEAFPKDKATAQPAHPHCLCHYAPVYGGEIDEKKRSNNVEENGRAWLAKQPLHIRQAILGVKGEQEWKAGRVGWMEKADVQQDFRKKESRLLSLFLQLHGNKNNATNNRLKNDIINKEIPLTEPLNFVNPEGTLSFIPFSTIIKVKRVIAGEGSDVVFRRASEYTSTFGGDMGLWQKVVGRIESARYSFDIHWVRRIDDNLNVRFKIKKF